MKVTLKIAKTVYNYGFGKVEKGSVIKPEYMMLNKNMIDEQDHNMAE